MQKNRAKLEEPKTKSGIIKVAVVEDNETIREGLKILIDSAKGFACNALFPDCESLIDNYKELDADILLIDIGLPGMNGIEGIKKIKSLIPQLTILVLTVYEENDLVFYALCAGASGYIVKKTPPSKMLAAIKESYYNCTPINSKIAFKVLNLFKQKKNFLNGSEKIELNTRENEILQYVIEGNNVKAIADLMKSDIDTINKDFKNIYEKLHRLYRISNNNGDK